MALEIDPTIPSAELSVSNICWPDTTQAHEVAMQVLANSGVNAIDIAPMMVFPNIVGIDPTNVSNDEIIAFRQTLQQDPKSSSERAEIRVAGFQGVTFGRSESIFDSSVENRRALVDHMKGIIHLAEFIGAQTIVYGCLGTRLFEDGLRPDEVDARAAEFFAELDPVARESNVVIGIEPVSAARAKKGTAAFGASGFEVVHFVSKLKNAHGTTHIKFLPDSFGIYDASPDIEEVPKILHASFEQDVLAPHAQMAEPGMMPPTEDSKIAETHKALDSALHTFFAPEAKKRADTDIPAPTLAIEMFSPKGISTSELRMVLNGAIEAARFHYRKTLIA